MSGLVGFVGKASEVLNNDVIKDISHELSKRSKKITSLRGSQVFFFNGSDESNKKGNLFRSVEDLIINFEGRLDNKKEIIKKLGLDINHSHNDAEVTLYSYLKWEKFCAMGTHNCCYRTRF